MSFDACIYSRRSITVVRPESPKSDGFDGLVALDQAQGNIEAKGLKVIDQDQGVATHVFAAFAPEAARSNGMYCHEARVAGPEEVHAWARDKVDAERLLGDSSA